MLKGMGENATKRSTIKWIEDVGHDLAAIMEDKAAWSTVSLLHCLSEGIVADMIFKIFAYVPKV